ncbi:MAG: C40 family peptidase [Clostridia bacterium]|nr:C40 family peptidase [Clostridia bacterium]
MHIKKIINKILVILAFVCILLTSHVHGEEAANTDSHVCNSSAELGRYIAQYAIDYRAAYGNKVKYSSNSSLRPQCYRLKAFEMDCAGFATVVWLNSNDVPLHRDEIMNSTLTICNGYWKGSLAETSWADIFDMVNDWSLQPGDLVIMSTRGEGINYCHHVGVYAGKEYGVIHCNGGITSSPLAEDGRKLTNAEYVIEGIIRVKESVAKGAHGKLFSKNSTLGDFIGEGIKKITSFLNGLLYGKEVKFIREDQGKIEKSIQDKTFEYQGVAKLESQTTQEVKNEATSVNVISWLFSKLSDLFSWILNFIFTVIKGVFVGATTLVQMLVTYWIDAAQGEDVSSRMSNGMMNYLGSGDFKKDAINSISLEKIVYNQVPILDPDVFNGAKAGGKTVSSDSLIVIIRNLVAGLYTAMRQMALIGLLIALIYLGIKVILTSAGEAKGEYRKQLMNWLIAFIIIFIMHYFILGVLRINEIVVDLLQGIGTNIAKSASNGEYVDLALAMRGLTYNSAIAQSLLATVLYMVMVYYMIKFLIMYFRRLFVIMILIILAPLLVIKNAYSQIKNGKASDGVLTKWVKEYIFSVGTQTIHAIIYTIFVSITYQMLLNTDTGKIALCILSIMFFRLMTTAEKILRKLLDFSGEESKSIIGELAGINVRELVGLAVARKIYPYTSIANTLTPNILKRTYSNVKHNVKESTRTALQNEYIRIKKDEYLRKYGKEYSPNNPTILEKPSDSVKDKVKNKIKYTIEDIMTDREIVAVDSDIDNQITEILRDEFDYKLANTLEGVSSGKQFLSGLGKMGFGLTLIAGEDTAIGFNRLLVGTSTVKRVLAGRIRNYKSTENVIRYRGKDGTYRRIEEWSKLNGTQEVARELKYKYLTNKDNVTSKNELKIASLHEARKVEMELKNEIDNKKNTLFKGTRANATPIEQTLSKKYTDKLKKSVYDAMKTVDREDINKEVKDYVKKTKKHALTLKDFENISERFDVKVSGQIVMEGKNGPESIEKVEKDAFIENVKRVTMAKMIQEVVTEDKPTREITLDEETLDKMEDNINNNSGNAKDKDSMNKAIECIKEKKKEMKGQGELKVYSNLTEEEKAKVNKVLEDAISEDMVQEQIPKMNTEQIVNTMKQAVNKEGSIKKEKPIKEFKPIIDKVSNLRDIDELSRQVDNKPIYEDVGTLVETMINNTNVGDKGKKQNTII